jgi:UV DNA damage endonuclease
VRLGTGPRLFSRPDLRTYDTRLPFEARQLSVGLVCLHDLLLAAHGLGISFYRLATPLLPMMGPADLARCLRQLDACLALAEWVGATARALGMRLTVHPVLDVQLGSEDGAIAGRGAAFATAWQALFAAMGLGREACVVVHRGGSGRRAEAAFAANVGALPEAVRQRLALENDERQCDLGAALRLSGDTGLPVVWDYLHWRCNGADRRCTGADRRCTGADRRCTGADRRCTGADWHSMGADRRTAGAERGWSGAAWRGADDGTTVAEAYAAAAATWPPGVRPKLHYSSPRTTAQRGRPPQPREHADYLDPFAFRDFAAAVGADCDVMLEARAKDLALVKLRRDLAPAAPADEVPAAGGALAAAG